MKPFLRYVLLLATATVLLALANDALNVWLIRHSCSNTAYKMERLYSRYPADEIPIVGSSRAQQNIVPTLISPRCFNYGIDGESIAETIAHLRAIAARGEMTSPVIVNIDPWSLVSSADRFFAEYTLAPQSRRTTMLDRIPGIRFYGRTRKSFTDWLNEKKAVSKVIDNGGVFPIHTMSMDEWKIINERIKPRSFKCDAETRASLTSAISGLAPRHVYVLVAPCSSRFRELYKGKEEMRSFYKMLDELPNAMVIDSFDAAQFPDSDFNDGTHLNRAGAEKYTASVIAPVVLDDANCKN